MSLKGIFAYTIRAVGFGAVAGGLYWLILRMRGKKAKCEDALAVVYLAAVAEIIALRFGAGRVQRMIQWIPLKPHWRSFRAARGRLCITCAETSCGSCRWECSSRGKNRNGRTSKFSRQARRFPQCLNCFNLRCVPA